MRRSPCRLFSAESTQPKIHPKCPQKPVGRAGSRARHRQGAAIRDAGPAAPAFPRRPRVHAPNLRTCRCTMDGTLRSTTVCRGTRAPTLPGHTPTQARQDALSRRWPRQVAGGWFGGEIWRANPSASVIFSPAASVPRWRGAVWIPGFVRAVGALRSGSETFPDWTPSIPCVVGGGQIQRNALDTSQHQISTRSAAQLPNVCVLGEPAVCANPGHPRYCVFPCST